MLKNWSESEVKTAVEDYFSMLRQELTGKKYNKSRHRHALIVHLNNRSEGSIELKHQNISAVLIEMGIPYIDGYKPRFNYQRSLLPEAITSFLNENPDLYELFKENSDQVPSIPDVKDILAAMENPPKHEDKSHMPVPVHPGILNPAGINYLEREAHNQKLGEAGEKFAINFEKARLIRAGKESLADLIEQVSETVGPSAGFDILSFEENGTDRYIEAKTTKHGKSTPFFITPHELEISQKKASHYFLYRIFRFQENPRIFYLHGSLQGQCVLKPSQYLARPG